MKGFRFTAAAIVGEDVVDNNILRTKLRTTSPGDKIAAAPPCTGVKNIVTCLTYKLKSLLLRAV